MFIDPTKRSVVSWQDWDGPHSSNTRLTVAWLDEDDREMAQDIRGMHAYWMAQAFKARDAVIKERGERIDAISRDNSSLRAELREAVDLVCRLLANTKHFSDCRCDTCVDARAFLVRYDARTPRGDR